MNDKKSLVSVIVPVYNAEKYLDRCVTSILSQTYKNLEIILINDGSTDKSLIISNGHAKLDARIRIISTKNGGVSAARNKGLDAARGDYITLIDADDAVESTHIENMLSYLENRDKDVVRCKYIHHLENRTVHEAMAIDSITLDSIVAGRVNTYTPLLMIRNHTPCSNLRFEIDIGFMEDKIYYADLIKTGGPIPVINSYSYHYKSNPTGKTQAASNYSSNIYSTIDVTERINARLDNNTQYIRQNNLRCIGTVCYFLYKVYLHHPDELTKFHNELLTNSRLIEITKNRAKYGLSIPKMAVVLVFEANRTRLLAALFGIRKQISRMASR